MGCEDSNPDQFDGVVRLPNGQGQCMKCGLICATVGSVNRHFEVKHAPAREHKCHICGALYYNRIYLTEHLRRAQSVKVSDWKKAGHKFDGQPQ